MPLPTPNLDDRKFQEIVDEAKRRIPYYCSEWTDHNVSDPGVALIELFAWMTEMLLYRVNQVPDKMYIKFLEMIGVRLEAPRPAQVMITFYLSAAQNQDVPIDAGTEVSTIRTDDEPPIIFSTEKKFEIRTPVVIGAFTRDSTRGNIMIPHDLHQLEVSDKPIPIFSERPAHNDAFYLAFEKDHSHHVLALIIQCAEARGAGIDPTNPPWQWEVWYGGEERWSKCEIEKDSTGGFNQDGVIILHIPTMKRELFQDISAFWLRCRLTAAQQGTNHYEVSPKLKLLHVEARGGTVGAHNAVTVYNEIIGRSDGTPGQTFKLLNTPILARDPRRDYLMIELPDGTTENWVEQPNFADSGPEDRHYTLDELDGTLALGPSLLQPGGRAYHFSQVPPPESTLRFSRYQYGGGIRGNVPKGALTVIRTSIPFVAHATNREAASGGREPQSLEEAKLRAPQFLRTRTRAMTADDYEYLACAAGAARAHCISPGVQHGTAAAPNGPEPGNVAVYILPHPDSVQDRIPTGPPSLSEELRISVKALLDERRPLGTALEVLQAQYLWVSVEATLRLPPQSGPDLEAEIRRQAEAALYRYLNPYVGGPQGKGWPFGRSLHVSEIYKLLQQIAAVEFVDEIRMGITIPGKADRSGLESTSRLQVPAHAVICSDRHQVLVKTSEED